MLEDESGRLRLIGPPLADEMLVTGCIVAVMGTENANGDFEVVDIRVPDLPPQPERWASSKPPAPTNGSARPSKKLKLEDEDEDEKMQDVEQTSGSKLAIVSGLGISGTSTEQALQLDLLLEYLIGEALDPASQQQTSRISRLIIAGNSLASETDAISHDTVGNTRKAQKKYGYDSSAYNPAPTAHLDNFLASLLPSMPVTLIPGESDPANVSLPQQPIHSAMFPQARTYAAIPGSGKGEDSVPGWFDAVTNPWDGEIDGWRVLGTGGQNIDDVFKYVESEDRLSMLEAMCRWRCVAPTAPDTLCEYCSLLFLALNPPFTQGTTRPCDIANQAIGSYPFQDIDPFVLNDCPHLFFAGSQPKFDTAMIEGQDGQMVRLIAVPRFSETGEIVLVDSETLEVERVQISIFDPEA
jgi:DNA polymerase delta subunit 2